MATINIGRKELFFFAGVLVLLVGAGFGVAFGGSNPAVMGHNAEEISGLGGGGGTDTRCDVEDACSQLCIGSECRTSFVGMDSYEPTCQVTDNVGDSCDIVCGAGYVVDSSTFEASIGDTWSSDYSYSLIDSQTLRAVNEGSVWGITFSVKCIKL